MPALAASAQPTKTTNLMDIFVKPIKRTVLAISGLLSALPINTYAALYDRGNGMIYDSSQNITWLQDANYAQTSGYDADGRMTWANASTWANNLVFGGYNDWRLAATQVLNLVAGCSPYNGQCDISYNHTRSEIGHLYFELGNIAYYSNTGAKQTGYGFLQTSFFSNVQTATYWEAEQYSTNSAFVYSAANGGQDVLGKNNLEYAWAVRDGDVAAVPMPAAIWLFGSGLIGLAGLTRKRKTI